MGGHAGYRQASDRVLAEAQITSPAPIRVSHDRLPPYFMKSNVLRRMTRGSSKWNRRKNAIGVAGSPLQHLHGAHRSADHAEQAFDPKMIEQQLLRPHHVADRNNREGQSPGITGRWVDLLRAGRSHTAAQHIGAYQKIAIDVEHPTGAD